MSELGPKEFDLFTAKPSNGSAEEQLREQRAFELWWKRQTGRSAIVVGGFEYEGRLEYK